jgi:hypothetical protein
MGLDVPGRNGRLRLIRAFGVSGINGGSGWWGSMSSPASVKLVRVLLNLGFVVHDRFQQCLRVFSCEVMDICLAERSQASSVEPDSLDRPPLFV